MRDSVNLGAVAPDEFPADGTLTQGTHRVTIMEPSNPARVRVDSSSKRKENEEEAEPESDLEPERLTFSQYQRWYHEIFGEAKYSTVYKAWLDYCAEYDSLQEAASE